MRGERARLVGLVLPELQNPIFPAFAEVIGGALAQQGLTPVLCTQTKGGVSEADYVELLLQQQVSGVVFAGGLFAQADAPHEHYRLLAERNIPVVLINASIENLHFPCIACDDAVAVEQSWRHLVSLGHERHRPGARPSDHIPSRRKLAAAQDAAQAMNAELPEEFVERAMSPWRRPGSRLTPAGARSHRHHLRQRPLALGAVRAARRRGLHVPTTSPSSATTTRLHDPPAPNPHSPPSANPSKPWDAPPSTSSAPRSKAPKSPRRAALRTPNSSSAAPPHRHPPSNRTTLTPDPSPQVSCGK